MSTPAIPELCRQTLERNWREGSWGGREFSFSVPSPRSYPWQWQWDSCFHALVRRRFDPAGARRELESLLAAQSEGLPAGADSDGFIGHTIFWAHQPGPTIRMRYNLATPHALQTATIQPPLIAWAWGAAVGDPELEPRISAQHDWLERNRVLDDSGLLWIIQPDESGMDALPKFDHIWGHEAQGLPLFVRLIAQNRKLGFDARRIAAAGRPLVCEVLTNVAWSLSRQALGQSSVTDALCDRLWWERAGRFCDKQENARRPLEIGARPLTWDTLAPLALPDLPEEIAERLVELWRREFAAFVPLPSVAPRDPAYSPNQTFHGLRRHWRGPSWVNAAMFVWCGLLRLGLDAEARQLAERLVATVSREGLREYYESHSGAGMAAHEFGWSTLVWELADPDPVAARSFLPARG